MNILALETSHQPGQLALHNQVSSLYQTHLPANQRTTESFAAEIQRALSAVGWRPDDVELFAVCDGPGSFTGLRIGITAAKTFAYATGCRVMSVNTLDLLAGGAIETVRAAGGSEYWAVLDAQRRQLFVAQYAVPPTPRDESSPSPLPHRLTDITIVDAPQWLNELSHNSWVTGSGLNAGSVRGRIPNHVHCTPSETWVASAPELARQAWHKTESGVAESMWQLTVNYFRKSAAEEKAERRASDTPRVTGSGDETQRGPSQQQAEN